MAMPQKGSRRIVVDGQIYRWRVRRAASYSQLAYGTALSYAIQHSGGGSVLLVYAAGSRAENWLGLPATVVTPARVADAIRRAVTAGWLPTGPGRVVSELFVLVGR